MWPRPIVESVGAHLYAPRMTPPNEANPRTPLTLLWMLTLAAVLLHGYHYGVQDQAIYLPAIKKLLNPELYPYDAAFIEAQARFMWFDELVATSVKLTHLPLEWVLLGWQLMTIFGLLLGCWRVAEKCFAAEGARWGAVLMVAAAWGWDMKYMFTHFGWHAVSGRSSRTGLASWG